MYNSCTIKKGLYIWVNKKTDLMKNFILQTFDKKEMRKVSFKKWDIVIKMAEKSKRICKSLV